MPGAIANSAGDIANNVHDQDPFGDISATLMNPLNALMNPLTSAVGREQKEGISDLKDLMHEMIAEIHKGQDGPDYVDIGGKDTRPSDLAAHFDPKMDQDINLYTGSGDDMVIIV